MGGVAIDNPRRQGSFEPEFLFTYSTLNQEEFKGEMHMIGRGLAIRLLATTALTLGMGAALPALAQEGASNEVETLIVTAGKRAENIQDVPMSVTAVSGDYLEKTGIGNVSELSKFIPSVIIAQSNNNRNTSVFVRGIGTSGTNPGIESSVGIFIDGVYIVAAGPIQGNLQDISTVEVLRGPQGTLYGRNTPVGAINITSREPTQAFESMINVRAAKYDDYAIGGYVGGGLTENVSARVSMWASTRDGYEKNLSGPEVNNSDQYGFRARVKWEPTDTIDANFIAYYSHIKSNCCTPETLDASGVGGIATPGFLAAAAATGKPFRNFDDSDHVVDDDFPGKNVTDVYGLSISVDFELPMDLTLTSITAFNGYEDNIKNLAADGLPQITTIPFGSNQFLRSEGYSQEFRITSPADQRFSYILGTYLFSQGITYTTSTTLGPDANRLLPPAPGRRLQAGDNALFYYTQDTKSIAFFGQGTFKVTDVFRLTGGLRWSEDKKDSYILADVSPTTSAAARAVFSVNRLGKVKRKEDKVQWSAGAQFDATPDVMIYALAASGYKTGGFNARSAAAGVPVEFGPETSITYELGVKSVLADGRLVLNADVYSMTLKEFQDSTLNPLTGTGFIVANAGDRRVRGVEADAQWRVAEPLTLKGSVGYMDAEFTDYTAGQCNNLNSLPVGTRAGTCNYNGRAPAYSPKWTASLAAQYDAPLMDTGLNWFVNADISYVSSKFMDTTLDPRSFEPSVTLLGLRAGISSPKGWRISAFGKNLTDEAYFYAKSLQPLNAFISAGGLTQAQGFVGWYAPPRTYGIEASAKF